MSGDCDYCGSYEHVEGNCPVAKDPDKMWDIGYSSGHADGWNSQNDNIDRLRVAKDAEIERLKGKVERRDAALKEWHDAAMKHYPLNWATDGRPALVIANIIQAKDARIAQLEEAGRVLGEECRAWRNAELDDSGAGAEAEEGYRRLSEAEKQTNANPNAAKFVNP